MMSASGLNKLMEECGELVQVAAKKAAYPNTDAHPDGSSLKARMEEEMADVLAAIHFVAEKLSLNLHTIDKRKVKKVRQFREWDVQP